MTKKCSRRYGYFRSRWTSIAVERVYINQVNQRCGSLRDSLSLISLIFLHFLVISNCIKNPLNCSRSRYKHSVKLAASVTTYLRQSTFYRRRNLSFRLNIVMLFFLKRNHTAIWKSRRCSRVTSNEHFFLSRYFLLPRVINNAREAMGERVHRSVKTFPPFSSTRSVAAPQRSRLRNFLSNRASSRGRGARKSEPRLRLHRMQHLTHLSPSSRVTAWNHLHGPPGYAE